MIRNVAKYISLILTFVVIFFISTITFSTTSVSAANEKGNILNNNKVSIPKSNDVASNKYAVIAKFTRGTSKLVYSGPARKMSYNNRALIVEPANSQKGKIRALYTNVGAYNGRTLDFELIVTDWVKAGFNGGEFMHFYDTHIGFSQGGYTSVALQGTYLYSDTGKPATDLTGSYMTVNDLDANQFMGFSQSMYNKIDKMYAYDNSWVSLWRVGTKYNIGARFYEALDSDDKRGYVTFLVSGHQFNFDWHKDWTRPSSNNQHYNFNRVLNWYNEASAQYFGYRSEKPVRTETLIPSKRAINKKGDAVKTNEVNASETFNYEVYHTVPNEYSEFFYNSYEMKDKIDEMLDIKEVKVYNESNNDVTSKFNVNIKDNLITAKAKANQINKLAFYATDYRFVITVKAKDPEDLIWITKGEPTYQLTNKASVTINNETKDTNVVTTTIKYNPEDLYTTRCYHNKNNKEHKDEVVGVTSNEVVVTKGYLPSESSEVDSFVFRSEATNESYDMLMLSNKRPIVGWSESEWNQWKRDFQNGSLNTKSIDFKKFVEETGFEEINVKRILQENGGILNVERLHHKSKMSIELCQNQVRTPNFETQKWEWHDKGGKEVHKIESPEYNISVENDSYQILGVNCNVDGVNRIIKDFEANYEIEDHSYDTKSGGSRLLVVSPKKPGAPFPLGKVNHYTGKDNFYNPDGIVWKNSCQADFSKACKSTPLSGSEVKNDSNRNNNNKTFSMVENPGDRNEEYHFPGDKNQIMFFRDNKDRQVRADVWYLDKNDKTYSSNKNAAAKQTDLRVLSGTPEIKITTISPWGTADSISKFGEDSTYEKQHINRINVKSRWSSKENEPYKVGMAWTYEATAKNLGVVEIDGYKINKLETNEHEFDAICSFQKKPGSYQAVIPRNLFVSGKIDSNDKWKFSDTMEIVFTRSISDRVTGK